MIRKEEVCCVRLMLVLQYLGFSAVLLKTSCVHARECRTPFALQLIVDNDTGPDKGVGYIHYLLQGYL